ncbi:MAG: CcmD family protein [Chitinophagaceae bacterium]|nr:MAG: CcmD family protein [Chitinophagaceae bacterium]
MKKYTLAILLLLMNCFLFAQQTVTEDGAATGMRSEGKIYVVVAVVVTILAGLILFLVRLDRKISRLEQKKG